MDKSIELAVAKVRLSIENVRKLELDLNRDFPNDANDEKSRLGREWQERIHQQSRDLMFIYSEFLRSNEEYSACSSAIEETIPLLEGSRYAKMQRERVKDLRQIYDFSKTLTSLPCA